VRIDGATLEVIQASNPEPRIMRYEFSEHEWCAIVPMSPNKLRDVPATYGPARRVTITMICLAAISQGCRLRSQ
jgi:hypothetical protein